MDYGNRLVYHVAGMDVDPAQGCIRRPNQPDQYLRPKAMQVLLYLLQHRGRAVPKEELLSHAWAGLSVTDDVLVGCIGEIRKALGDEPGSTQCIRTLAKVGYRFVATVEESGSAPPEMQPIPSAAPIPKVSLPITARGLYRRLILAVLLVFAVGGSGLVLLRKFRPGTGAASSHIQEVAWWRLNEGAGSVVHDSSGNGNTGFVQKPNWTSTGGRGLHFDGTNSWIAGRSPCSSCPSGSAPRTVTAWVKSASTNGDATTVLSYGSKLIAAKVNYMLGMRRDGRAVLGITYGPTTLSVTRLDDDRWHYLAATYEGSRTNLTHLFVDGIEEGSLEWPSAPETRITEWSIGNSLTEGGTPFRGVIDDVRIYDRVLRDAEIIAIYRCASRESDQRLPVPGTHYYLPVFGSNVRVEGPAAGPGIESREIQNIGSDFAGVQFGRSGEGCSADSLRGEDVGQNVMMRVDLLVPTDAEGHITEAGPYFRSRSAAPGDGLNGGTSAGYIVQLDSRGAVIVKRLNPRAIVAFTEASAGFDSTLFHNLQVTARETMLQVTLDGNLVTFDQAGKQVTSVSIPSAWLGPPPAGFNHGSAGIAFGAENNRGALGGQRARNVSVERLAETK